MREFRIDPGFDDAITGGIRALYAPPEQAMYWNELERRILTRVASVDLAWWDELDRWMRPALAAAAILILAAGAAMFRANQRQVDAAYDDLLSPPPVAGEPVQASVRPTLQDPRDQSIRFGLSGSKL